MPPTAPSVTATSEAIVPSMAQKHSTTSTHRVVARLERAADDPGRILRAPLKRHPARAARARWMSSIPGPETSRSADMVELTPGVLQHKHFTFVGGGETGMPAFAAEGDPAGVLGRDQARYAQAGARPMTPITPCGRAARRRPGCARARTGAAATAPAR